MREYGIFSVASLIVGLPGESPEVRKRAVESTVDIQPDSAHFLPFLPLPGTPLSQDHNGFDANPNDIHDARLFTELFFQHPSTKRNLAAAADSTEIRGRLARAALARFTAPDPALNLLSL
jgi:hypothetical protein